MHQHSFWSELLIGRQTYPASAAQLYSTFYIIEIVKETKMDFYSILISILLWFPPGKWVPLGQTVEDGSKHSVFFIGIQWPPLSILLINDAIILCSLLALS